MGRMPMIDHVFSEADRSYISLKDVNIALMHRDHKNISQAFWLAS